MAHRAGAGAKELAQPPGRFKRDVGAAMASAPDRRHAPSASVGRAGLGVVHEQAWGCSTNKGGGADEARDADVGRRLAPFTPNQPSPIEGEGFWCWGQNVSRETFFFWANIPYRDRLGFKEDYGDIRIKLLN